MANDFLAVADFVADALDVDKTLTTSVLNQSPLVAATPITDTSDGSSTHQWNVYTQAPVVGFRTVNAGRDYDSSIDTVSSATCLILDFSWRVDFALAHTWRQGAQDLIAREGLRHLGAALFKLEQQMVYGTTAKGDSAGFAGLIDNTAYDAVGDDMVINAAGTTADVQSSMWAIKFGFDHCRLVTPMDQGIQLGDTIVTEANESNHPVYYTPASLYIAYQVGAKYSAGRIANLNNATDSKPLTDDLISSLLATFPAGGGPDILVCNRTSLKDLQQSRTSTNPTGAPAPFPDNAFGVPIITSDAIVQTEAVET